MTDTLNPDVPDKPIEIPASPIGAQAATISRDLLLVAGAVPALIAILGTRDVTKIVAYISSVEFAPALGVIVAAGTMLYRQWLARKKHTNDKRMATAAPNSVAIVRGAIEAVERAARRQNRYDQSGSFDLVPGEPLSSDVIQQVEAILSRARSGEIASVAIAYVTRAGVIGRHWSQGSSAGTLIGSVEHMAFQMHRTWDGA